MARKSGGKKGRPTKYTPKLIQMVDEYLESCVDVEDEFHKTRGNTSDSYERTRKVNLPKIEGFARYIDVHKDTLIEWAKENDVFSVALDKIRTEQHNRLVDETLAGNYNPVIAKLMLSSNHGYREKTENEQNINMLGFVKDVYNKADELQSRRKGKK